MSGGEREVGGGGAVRRGGLLEERGSEHFYMQGVTDAAKRLG